MTTVVCIFRCLVLHAFAEILKNISLLPLSWCTSSEGAFLPDNIKVDLWFAVLLRYSSTLPPKTAHFLSSRSAWKRTILFVYTRNRLRASCCNTPTTRRNNHSGYKDRMHIGNACKEVCRIFEISSNWCTEAVRTDQMQATRQQMSEVELWSNCGAIEAWGWETI